MSALAPEIARSYGIGIWEAIAEDPVERTRFLEEFQGLSFLIQPAQTAEEWVAEAVERWCYRPPVSAHLIDNTKTGPPDVWLGPGPGGVMAAKLARYMMLGAGAAL